MIACVDVDYGTSEARAACIVFDDWRSDSPVGSYTTIVKDIAPYIPGEFYKRELPCLARVLNCVAETLDVIIVDGHVWTAIDHPGLGKRLHETMPGLTVVGVAKTLFRTSPATPIIRAGSNSPLYVDEVGPVVNAVERILEMHGPYRLPTMLKKVDRLARDGV